MTYWGFYSSFASLFLRPLLLRSSFIEFWCLDLASRRWGLLCVGSDLCVIRTVMAAVVFKINYRELLRDVCHRFSMAVPIYGVPVDDEGLFSVYGEVEISRGNSITEAIRCWGAASSTVDEAEEDAARRIIAKLRDEFMFEVHDSNYEDRKFFENLYERVSTDHIALHAKYKRLKSNYGLLKDYYNNLFTEKEHLVAARKENGREFRKILFGS
ncbi:uncharacterized protein LOC109705876 [Ananas comosus]|uniref:Uncharacterized protein LOC109705876 n=1 Tax=Ananas comosus TaxID=4615 RepID=A0A6P5ELL0_ANACO|nr:uncharacterized protein LOC109705876 [Ananas comosus]